MNITSLKQTADPSEVKNTALGVFQVRLLHILLVIHSYFQVRLLHILLVIHSYSQVILLHILLAYTVSFKLYCPIFCLSYTVSYKLYCSIFCLSYSYFQVRLLHILLVTQLLSSYTAPYSACHTQLLSS